MTRIDIYTTDPCPYCRHAKELLAQRGISFNEINLSKDIAGRAELAQRTGMMTFPQILIDNVLLGGFQELAKADSEGRLHTLASTVV